MTIPQKEARQSILLATAALLLFFVSLWIVTTWRLDPTVSSTHLTAHWTLFSGVNILWLGVLYIFDLLLIGTYKKTTWINTFFTASLTALIIAIVVFYLQPDLLVTPRRILLLHTIFSFGGFFLVGLILSHAKQQAKAISILFVGQHEREPTTFATIADRHGLSVDIQHHPTETLHQTSLDSYDIITFTRQAANTLPKKQLGQQAARVLPYTQLYEDALRRIPVSHLDQWAHVMPTGVSTTIYTISKRITDIVSGLILGVLFLLTAPFIIPAIKLTSPGPIFFTQRRVTLQGTPFTIYKYRTMRSDTPSNTWTTPKDPRITRVGYWLRKSHLDELPQAWNLLKGDLSLIGPRPEQEVLINGISEQIPFYLERHQIRCGLTGWAQLHVYAGTLEETKEKLEYDLYYVKHRSLLLDFEIALRTLRNLLRFDLYV